MSSKSLGTLTLDLIARTGGFVRGMDKAERRSAKWRRQVQKDLKRLRGEFGKFAKMAAGAGVAAAGAFTILAKEGLQYVDAQAKMARQIGGTIDGLRGLQIAANDAGVDTNTLNGAVDRMNARLGEAREGSGQAYEALNKLGLAADDLARMDADERIATIADRVKALGLDSADTADLLRNLGIRNREMVNLLLQGGDGIRAARQEVDDYGLSLSEVDAAKVEAANDAFSRIPRLLEPVKNQIAITLAEPMQDVADRINEAARETNGFESAIVDALGSGVEWAGRFLDSINDVYLLLLKAQRFQFSIEALGEQTRLNPGQGMGRMSNYGLDNPPLETGPATQRVNEIDSLIGELESGGGILNGVSSELAKWQDSIAQRREEILNGALELGGDGDGMISTAAINAAESVVGSMERVSTAANGAADALDGFNPSKSEEVESILDRAGEGASIDDGGQIRDAWGNALPTLQRELNATLEQQLADFKSAQNLQAGLEAAAQAFTDGATVAAKAAWASVMPQSADGVASGVLPTTEQAAAGNSTISWSTDLGAEKATQAASQVSGASSGDASGGGGNKQLGTLTLKSEEGGSLDVFTENVEAAEKWLADTLAGVAAGSR